MINLNQLDVLVIDCQATGANPDNGSLLELAWVRMSAQQPLADIEREIQSYLVKLPEGVEIPRQVMRVTGLTAEDMSDGLEEEEVWQRFMETVGEGPCVVVIHFARYEESFLRHCHCLYGGGKPYPFDTICTYKLSRRLVPRIPRQSLRAVAGYFGYSVPEQRRSWHHIAATAEIWRHAVPLLVKEGVNDLEGFKLWEKKKKKSLAKPEFPMAKEKRNGLPDRPGVYRMLRSNGDILYIGKATSLKKRVSSYFHKKKTKGRARLNLEMLSQAFDLDVTETGSALEAALLETDEIKRFGPQYNVALRRRDREITFYRGVPLPSLRFFAPFAAIHDILADSLDYKADGMQSFVMGMDGDYAPDVESFLGGVELFLQKHQEQLKAWGGSIFNSLMRLGKEFRQAKLEEMEQVALLAEEEESETIEEEEPEQERVWTPELVFRIMEGIVHSGAHLVRRGRWLCLLSESSLLWTSGESSGRKQRELMVAGGIVKSSEAKPGARLPVPQGHGKTIGERQACFDVITYDRLRVLTTEIRRLVQDKNDRDLQLCLGPNTILRKLHLQKLFKWV